MPRTPLVWCAAASLGVLFIKANTVLGFATVRSAVPAEAGVSDYLILAVPALALVLWHVFPGRSWPWLLLAGALFALPYPILQLTSEVYRDWMAWPLNLTTGSAPALTLVGVLAAATWVWRAGRRGVGAALIGTALVIQFIGPVVIGSVFAVPAAYSYRVLSLVLVIVAIVGAIGAVAVAGSITRQVPEPAPPSWRVTIAAGLAAMSPALAFVWQLDRSAFGDRDQGAIADYYLEIGLAFLAIGLVAGAAAGVRPLLTALAAGLMLGSFGMLIVPSVEVLSDFAVLTVIAAALSVLLGFAAALSRRRGQIGAVGLAIAVLGLLVMFVLFDRDDLPDWTQTFAEIMTPALLVIAVVAGIAALSSIGSVLAEHAETPAVLAGLTTTFSLGAIAIIAHLTLTAPDDRAPIVGLLPGAAGALLIAAVLLAVIIGRYRGPDPGPPEEPRREPAGVAPGPLDPRP